MKPNTTASHRVGVDRTSHARGRIGGDLAGPDEAGEGEERTAEVRQLVGEPAEHRLAGQAPHDGNGAEQRGQTCGGSTKAVAAAAHPLST